MLPLKTLCTPRYTVLYTSGSIGILFQHSLPSVWEAVPCQDWSPSHDPCPLCQLMLVSTPGHTGGSSTHVLAETVWSCTLCTDSRSPWGRADEHGHDGKAGRLLCPWPRACRALWALCCTKQAETQRPSLLAAQSLPLWLSHPPHAACPGCPAAHPALQRAPLVPMALCTAWSPLSSWGSQHHSSSGLPWEGARQRLRRWTPWTAPQPAHQAAPLALSCPSQVQHPPH